MPPKNDTKAEKKRKAKSKKDKKEDGEAAAAPDVTPAGTGLVGDVDDVVTDPKDDENEEHATVLRATRKRKTTGAKGEGKKKSKIKKPEPKGKGKPVVEGEDLNDEEEIEDFTEDGDEALKSALA